MFRTCEPSFKFFLLLIPLIAIFLVEGNNGFIYFGQSGVSHELLVSLPEEKSEKTEGTSPTSLVSAPDWKGAFEFSTIAETLFSAQQAPFVRSPSSSFSSCSFTCNNDEETPVMEMCSMPCCDEGNISKMLEVRHRMAQLQRRHIRSARGQTGLRPALWAAAIMAGQYLECTELWFQESAGQRKEEFQSRTTSWREWRLLSSEGIWQGTRSPGSCAAHDAHADVISTTINDSSTATASDGQGYGQRLAIPWSDGASSAANASYVWFDCLFKHTNPVGTKYADDALSHGPNEPRRSRSSRGSHQGGSGPAKTEPSFEGNEKRRRQSALELAVDGTRNEETGRKEQHAKLTLCGPCFGQEQGRPTRSRECQSAVAFSVEALPATVCDSVERLHKELPSLRHSSPGQCERCAHCGPQSATQLRLGVQEGANRQGRSSTNIRRGRGARQFRRHDSGLKGRELPKNPRRHELDCHELGGALIVGRPPRTARQAPKDVLWRATFLVFWQGRRCMTDMYTRQWPRFLPETNMEAVRLQWNHSIMAEEDFLSEWQAQAHATTLASALGVAEQTVVDAFALPLRHKVPIHRVRFDDEIVVYIGNENDISFVKITMHHDSLSPWPGKPWTVRTESVPEQGHELHEEDCISLMARRPSLHPRVESDRSSSSSSYSNSASLASTRSRTEEWRQTVLLFLDGRMLSVRIPWNNGDELVRQISNVAGIDRQGLLGIHFVRSRPSDLVQQDLQCLLLQTGSDGRPSSFLRLILVDLEVFEPNEVLPGTFKRFCKWLPMTVNRVSTFRLLELEQLLTDHRTACRLWHNKIIIPDGQLTPLHLEDGDYIKIRIGWHEGLSCSESEASSFPVENASLMEESESHSMFQLTTKGQQAAVEVDPLSPTAVCISDSPFPCLSLPGRTSATAQQSFPSGGHASSSTCTVRYDGPGRPPRIERPTWYQEV